MTTLPTPTPPAPDTALGASLLDALDVGALR